MSAIEQSLKNVMAWIDDRLPVTEAYEKHLSKYYAPKISIYGITSEFFPSLYWRTSYLLAFG